MVITESELRELWRDGRNTLPAFPTDTRFSPAAQDFLKEHQLEVRWAEARPLTSAASQSAPILSSSLPFSLDTLAALARLVAAEARRNQLLALARRLDTLAQYCLALPAAGQAPGLPPLPARAGSGPAFQPGPHEHVMLHWLNFLRATARQAAAQAAAAGNRSLAGALGQVSDEAAELGRQIQTGELGWDPLRTLTNSG